MAEEYSKYRRLIDRLFSGTEKGQVDWQLDPWSSRVQVDFTGYKVALFSMEGPEGEPYIKLSIYNESNEEVDSLFDSDLSEFSPGNSNYSSYWNYMTKLYREAYRKAKGVDQALDDILAKIEKSDIGG